MAEPAPGAPAVGAGRVLALVYGFFTLAAGARGGVQLSTKFHHAPMAYVLSAVAAVVYAAGGAAVLAAERRPVRRVWVRRFCGLELAGLLGVGTASLLAPDAFPDATVWSHFGSGYAFVPSVLPVLGLVWSRTPRAVISAVPASPTKSHAGTGWARWPVRPPALAGTTRRRAMRRP